MEDKCLNLFNSFISTQNLIMNYLIEIRNDQKEIKNLIDKKTLVN